MDTLIINDLKVNVSIGIYPQEKIGLQEVLVTLTLKMDLEKAKISDAIEDTLDYDKVVGCILDISQQKHYHLIEHFAFCCKEKMTTSFPEIQGCKVRVEKPTALPQARSSAVEIE